MLFKWFTFWWCGKRIRPYFQSIFIFLFSGRGVCTVRSPAWKSLHIWQLPPILLVTSPAQGGRAHDQIRPEVLRKQMRLRDSGNWKWNVPTSSTHSNIRVKVLGRECEANPPYLVATSAWGERVDQIVTCPAWRRMKVALMVHIEWK